MDTVFWVLFVYCMAERLTELLVSRRNQQFMSARGFADRESPQGLRAMVMLHGSWYASTVCEKLLLPAAIPVAVCIAATALFLASQALRFWALRTLGRFWNISVLTTDSNGRLFVSNGPYRYIRHPNYLVVIIELATLPLVGGALYTAIFYTICNAVFLRRRIALEEQHLFSISGYREEMEQKPRFIPGLV